MRHEKNNLITPLNCSCLIGWRFFLSTEPRSCVKHNCTHIPHSMCFMYSGKRHCKCIQACTSEQAEVCGSDGRTYRNECHLKRMACVNKKNVHMFKHGRCDGKLAGRGEEFYLQIRESFVNRLLVSKIMLTLKRAHQFGSMAFL